MSLRHPVSVTSHQSARRKHQCVSTREHISNAPPPYTHTRESRHTRVVHSLTSQTRVSLSRHTQIYSYVVAMISRCLQIIGLFCKRTLWKKRRYLVWLESPRRLAANFSTHEYIDIYTSTQEYIDICILYSCVLMSADVSTQEYTQEYIDIYSTSI